MAKSIPALINPTMLKWAREKSLLTVDQAAEGIGVSVEKLEASEAGEGHLTFPQFLKAANLYKRAPSIFYLESPPEDYQPVRDFRRLPDLFDAGFSPKLATALREAQERRDLALELYKDLNEPLAPFDLSGAITDDVEEIAGKIRRALGVTQVAQITWRAKAFDNWRLAIESKDVLVFMVPSLPLSDMRGAAFASPTLPMILINSKDRTNGRTFTLLHEFCHLVLRASGVSGFGPDEGSSYESRVERFCNAVAAAVLVPKDWLLSEPLVARKGTEMTWQNDELQALAVRFGVSREVVLRRLLTIGRTSRAFYERCRPMFQKEYDDLEEKTSKGGPKQHFVVLSRFGRAYTRLVLQGYHERQLTLRDVAGHLNMQVKNVPAVERAAFGLGA